MGAELTVDLLREMYSVIKRIREFELKSISLFRDGLVPGFTHSYCGQEAVAVGMITPLRLTDRLATNHRGHGHMIAKGADTERMMAEILGKDTGHCRGRGGELHIMDVSIACLGANGVVGGGIPMATGAALADQLAGNDNVTMCFFGDGASSQGTLAESLNMAANWKLPVVFVCENNGYGEFTAAEDACAGRIYERAGGYGIPGVEVDGQNVAEVYEVAVEAIERARAGLGPTLIEAKTFRFHGHFYGEEVLTGDLPYRTKELIDHWMNERDPLKLTRARCLSAGVAEPELDAIDAAAMAEVERCAAFAIESPLPDPATASDYVYAMPFPA